MALTVAGSAGLDVTEDTVLPVGQAVSPTAVSTPAGTFFVTVLANCAEAVADMASTPSTVAVAAAPASALPSLCMLVSSLRWVGDSPGQSHPADGQSKLPIFPSELQEIKA